MAVGRASLQRRLVRLVRRRRRRRVIRRRRPGLPVPDVRRQEQLSVVAADRLRPKPAAVRRRRPVQPAVEPVWTAAAAAAAEHLPEPTAVRSAAVRSVAVRSVAVQSARPSRNVRLSSQHRLQQLSGTLFGINNLVIVARSKSIRLISSLLLISG